jgi:predicted GNAT family acetyltransferase
MSELAHDAQGQRYELAFPDGVVWADYSRQGDTLAILHVEAEPQLRNTGAAGQFMQALVDRARADGLKLRPVCGYAVMWLRRHRDSQDVVSAGSG